MFIYKIKNWLLSEAVVSHMSCESTSNSFFENKIVFMSVNKPNKSLGIQDTPEFKSNLQLKKTAYQNAETSEAKLKLLDKDIARLKRFVVHVENLKAKGEKEVGKKDTLKGIQIVISKLEAARDRYKIKRDKITQNTLKGLVAVDVSLKKLDRKFNGGNAEWVDPGENKPAANSNESNKNPHKAPRTPSKKLKNISKPKKVQARTVSSNVKRKSGGEKVGKTAVIRNISKKDNIKKAIENKLDKTRNDLTPVVADLVNGFGMTERGAIVLKNIFALMRKDKNTHRFVLSKSYIVHSVDNETGKGITRKDVVNYNAVIEKSSGGQYFKITITPDDASKYIGPRELYLVEKNGTVELRAKHQIDNAKIKFNGNEVSNEAPSKEVELSNLLAIIENEGERGFQRYSRDKIDRRTGKISGPGRLKELIKGVCGDEVGNNKLVKLPNGYSIFTPEWDEPYGKAERIIMKGSEIVAMQMRGGNLRYARAIRGNENPGIARRAAEVIKSRVFLPKILKDMRFRGEGEFKKPYFPSVENMNQMRDVLISFAQNAKKSVDQLTLNYDGGITVYYEADVDGGALFTMKFGNGFTMYFNTAKPNEFGLPVPDEDGYEVYDEGEMIPTPKEENLMRKAEIEKKQDNVEIEFHEDNDRKKAIDKAKIQKRDNAKKSLNTVTSIRKNVLSQINKNMGKFNSISTVSDTWPSIEQKAKVNVDDVIKYPNRYKLSRGKFVFKIKGKSEMNSSERRLVKKTKIHELLGLQKEPLNNLPLRVTIIKANGERVRGIRYPEDKTVYELGKSKIDKNRLRFRAGDTIKVSLLTDEEVKAQKQVAGVLKMRASLIKSVSKKKDKLGNKLKNANAELVGFIKSYKAKEGWKTYKGANLLDAWPKKKQLAKYFPLMKKQVVLLEDLDKNA